MATISFSNALSMRLDGNSLRIKTQPGRCNHFSARGPGFDCSCRVCGLSLYPCLLLPWLGLRDPIGSLRGTGAAEETKQAGEREGACAAASTMQNTDEPEA